MEWNNKEIEDFGDNYLFWNFYDLIVSDKLVIGVINVDWLF